MSTNGAHLCGMQPTAGLTPVVATPVVTTTAVAAPLASGVTADVAAGSIGGKRLTTLPAQATVAHSNATAANVTDRTLIRKRIIVGNNPVDVYVADHPQAAPVVLNTTAGVQAADASGAIISGASATPGVATTASGAGSSAVRVAAVAPSSRKAVERLTTLGAQATVAHANATAASVDDPSLIQREIIVNGARARVLVANHPAADQAIINTTGGTTAVATTAPGAGIQPTQSSASGAVTVTPAATGATQRVLMADGSVREASAAGGVVTAATSVVPIAATTARVIQPASKVSRTNKRSSARVEPVVARVPVAMPANARTIGEADAKTLSTTAPTGSGDNMVRVNASLLTTPDEAINKLRALGYQARLTGFSARGSEILVGPFADTGSAQDAVTRIKGIGFEDAALTSDS